MSIPEIIRSFANGGRVIRDWLGDDAICVPPEEAQRRADICLTCPLNDKSWKPGAAIAEAIKEQVEMKNLAKMTVDGEAALHTCKACLCHLPLKIHIPREKLVRYSTAEDLAKYDIHCWILTEP